jgi:hypothetical protein
VRRPGKERAMKIYKVTDPEFVPYGRVVEGVDFGPLVDKMQETPLPDGVAYEPSVDTLEALPVMKEISDKVYGEMPVQIGYCNGHNELLNAVEYHRDSEINVAATDAILILGKQQDITADFTYDTSLMKAFLVPKGTAVEIYATTLHYAPCGVDGDGFKVSVILPRGTNFPLKADHKGGEDSLITAVNKWLIGHAEGGFTGSEHIGLIGKNLNINE